MRQVFSLVSWAPVLLPLAGCATVATIQSADVGTAKWFSGTRLDWRAVTDQPTTSPLFRTAPPPVPWLDLPFSFALDIVVLPWTSGVGLSFGR